MVSDQVVKRLNSLGIPVCENLPKVEGKSIRTAKEVAQRVNVLGVLLAISDDVNSIPFFRDLLDNQGMLDCLSPVESRIVYSGKLSKQEEIDLSWVQESLYALVWCLGLFSEMNNPVREAELNQIFPMLPPEVDLNQFVSNAKLIDVGKIVEEVEFYYDLHWARRHPESWSFFNKPKFDKYKISVIRERRKALEWVIDSRVSWDEISLDT